MNLTDYIKGMIPTFKKDQVLDSCDLVKQTIVEHTLSLYTSSIDTFRVRGFKSQELKNYVLIYDKTVKKVSGGGDIIIHIKENLENGLMLLDHIKEESNKEFNKEEASIALTYRKSTYLRTIQAISFYNEYARKFLNFIYIAETSNADKMLSIKHAMLPKEIMWVENNFVSFCEASNVIGTRKEQYIKLLDKVPDSNITELTETTFPTTIGKRTMDPFNMQGLLVTYNPFYIIGMWIASYQASRYQAAQAEMELVQMRKLNLERIVANQPDAKLQKQIEYMQERVDSLEYKIHKMDEAYGL